MFNLHGSQGANRNDLRNTTAVKQNNIGDKVRTNVSHALWIPLIWMIYSAARPISFWISSTPSTLEREEQYLEGSPFDRNILLILIVLTVIILSKRNIQWKAVFKTNAFILIWFIYCGISILWSEFPFVSFKRWIKDIGLLLSVLIVFTEANPINAVKILIRRFSYILISFSVILIALSPSSQNYAGVSFNKNGLGRICMVSGMFFFANLISMRKLNASGKNDRSKIMTNGGSVANKESYLIQMLFMLVAFYLLGIINSATSLGGLMIGIVAYVTMGFGFIKNNIRYIWILTIIAIVTGIIVQYSFDLIGMFITSLGRDVTLTGRIYIWKDLLAFNTDPWIGVGYGSFWLGERLLIMWDRFNFPINESHNGYLNVYLELGMVGIFLLAGVIYTAFKSTKKALITNFTYGRFRMAMLIIVLLYNITEDAFARFTLMWFIFVLIAIDLPNENRGRNAINPFLPHGRPTTDQRIP